MTKPPPADIIEPCCAKRDNIGDACCETAAAGRTSEAVDRVIRERRATRNFAPTPVARRMVAEILDVARFAPSGGNTQPWTVYVLGGRVKEAVSESLREAHSGPARDSHVAEYAYYSLERPEEKQRRYEEFGRLYYGALGIRIDDIDGRLTQTGKNYSFFGAPIGLIFTIDRRLEKGSWVDTGMFIQNVMLAATSRGLATCPQAAFAKYHALIRRILDIPDEEIVVCGMSLGYAAPDCVIPRMPKARVSDFATFLGFDEEA